jgi:hypothetical protein
MEFTHDGDLSKAINLLNNGVVNEDPFRAIIRVCQFLYQCTFLLKAPVTRSDEIGRRTGFKILRGQPPAPDIKRSLYFLCKLRFLY